MNRKSQLATVLSFEKHPYLRTASRRIGVFVAVVCAAMVLIGAALLLGYLWLRSGPLDAQHASESRLEVSIDPIDFIVAGIGLGAFAVAVAGLAAVWTSRRAVEPLAEAYERQRTFVADASHELRTPLAVLSARAQQLALLTKRDEKIASIAQDLRDDVKIMVDIVDDLLAAASFDATTDPGNLQQALEFTVDKLNVLAEEKQNHIRLDISPNLPNPIYVTVPQTSLQRVLVALVDNALGHSPAGAEVSISATPSRNRRLVTLLVSDHGSGIEGISPERVFERFATGSAQSSSRSSHGIGLALVADVAERYDGSVKVTKTGPTGTIFEVKLPIVQDNFNE